MKVTAKQFKQGYIYYKNNYTIYYSSGRYFFNCLNDSNSFYTLKDLKMYLKTI